MGGRILNFSIFTFRGQEGQDRRPPSADDAAAEQCTCGRSPRVRSCHLPREDHTSNLVGPVRDVIGLVGRRRLFRAVRQIRRK